MCVNGVVGFAGLRVTLATLARRPPPGPGQQGVADRRRPGRAAGPPHARAPSWCRSTASTAPSTSASARRDPTARPACAARAHRQRRAVPGPQPRRAGRRHRRRRARPPDLEDGPEDHRRLVDADEQGPRGDRGPRAVRRAAGARVGIGYDHIDVVVHPQSIVHSMVEFTDGATIAQLSSPTCACPSATPWPGPTASARPFGRHRLGRGRAGSTSSRPTSTPSRAWASPTRPAAAGETAPAWLNAANEVAVEAFLDGRIRWIDIPDVLEAVLDRHDGGRADSADCGHRRRSSGAGSRPPASSPPVDAGREDDRAHDRHHRVDAVDRRPDRGPAAARARLRHRDRARRSPSAASARTRRRSRPAIPVSASPASSPSWSPSGSGGRGCSS